MTADSFLLYTDCYKAICVLTDEQLGRLFRYLFRTVQGEQVQVDADIIVAYQFIISQIERDREKYEYKCEVRRQAGRLGGLAKGKNTKDTTKIANVANANFAKQNVAKIANANFAKQYDNDNDNDNDNGNDNVHNKDKSLCVCVEKEKEKEKTSATAARRPRAAKYTHIQTLLKIFLSRNIQNPSEEVYRLQTFYKSEGKSLGPAQLEAKAALWTPQDAAPRFPENFLCRWKEIVNLVPSKLVDAALSDDVKYREVNGTGVITCDQSLIDWLRGPGYSKVQPILRDADDFPGVRLIATNK